MPRRTSILFLVHLSLVLAAYVASADDQDSSRFNLKSPTLGGKQFWYDELVYGDWRIQRNVLTKHYRLLADELAPAGR